MKVTVTIVSALIISLLSLSVNAQVVINEFSASNYDQFYGGGVDWLELKNTGGAAVNLSGYHLSDKESNPTKWAFPAGVTINPGQNLVVLLHSELDDDLNGNLCTNFRITQTENNEWVVFADPGGVIIDSKLIDQPTQMNHSWGRSSDGAADWKVFTTPTPGAANVGASYEGYAPKPTLDVDPGIYGGPFNVNISSTDVNAIIRFTTNGNFPNAGSNLYGAAINVAANTVLKAIAFSTDPEILPSFIETNTYLIGVSHTIPIVCVSGDQIDDLLNGNGWLRPLTTFEYFTAAGVQIDEVEGDSNEHGNDSNAYAQRGFDFIVRDQLGYNDEIEAQIFRIKDRDKYQRVIMKAAANDNYTFENGAHIRDAYVHTLSQVGDLRMDERSYEPCILYVNGQYWGVYDIREKVDDLDFTDHYYDQPRHYVDFIKTWGGTWEEYGSINDWNSLRDYILANDMTDQANYDYVTNLFNTGSLIDYFILNGYVVCMDWLNWNTAWWRGRHPDGDKKKWRYALWDMDATFGHYVNYTGVPNTGPTADPCDPESLGNPGGQGHVPILNKLFDNEDFTADYLNRYADLSNTVFSCEFMNHHLDSLIGLIEPEMQGQVDRWGGTYAGWQGAVQTLRDFIDARCNDVVIAGMEDCYDVEAITITIIIDGYGEVLLNTITLDPSDSPFTGSYFANIPIQLTGIDGLEGFFVNWEVTSGDLVIPDPNNPEIIITVTGDVTIVAHFVTDLDPVLVQWDVLPAGAGEILVDGVIAGPYPNTVLMDAATLYGLDATANDWFVFDHWESINHNINPDFNANPAEITFFTTDSITAVFTEIEHYDLQVDVFPAGAGIITMDGVELVLPYAETLEANIDYNFVTSTTEPWYEFAYWTINNNVLSPDEFSLDVILNLTADDELIAVYTEIEHYDLTVDVFPAGAGTIDMDGVALALPYAETIEGSIDYNFVTASTDPALYEFSHWELNGNTLSPDELSLDVILTLTANDDLVAVYTVLEYFNLTVSVEPEGMGTVSLDGALLDPLPWSQVILGNVDYALITVPTTDYYIFSHWELGSSTISPDELSLEIILSLIDDEELVAVYVPASQFEVTILVDPPYSGTVAINGGDTLVSNSWTGILWGEFFGYNFTATPQPYFFFENWEIMNHGIADPLNPDCQITFLTEDTLIAHFTEDPYTWYVPNSFTPNGDGINDFFLPQGNAFNPTEYHCVIFNRWGQKVFETNDPTKPWDGSHQNGDYYSKDEIYFYIMEVRPGRELSSREYKGHIVVFR